MDPSLYELAVLSDGLLKAPGLYQKHKRMPLPTSKVWQPISGHVWMLKDNPDWEALLRYILLSHGYTKLQYHLNSIPAPQTSNRLSCGQSDYSCRCLKYSSAGSLGT